MLYALICTDKPNSLRIRTGTRPDHLAYLERLGDRVKFAGPFTADDGTTPTGSLVIVEAESRQAAEALAGEDPYTRAGLFASVDVRPWKWVIGNPDQA